MKLLCFINQNNIKTFFNKIINKFSDDFPNFFDKFGKIYFKTKPYNELYWNYSTSINNNLNKDLLFFTKKICETYNRKINLKFIKFI